MENFNINEMIRIRGRLEEIENQFTSEIKNCDGLLKTINEQVESSENFSLTVRHYTLYFLPRLLDGYTEGLRNIIEYLDSLIGNASRSNDNMKERLYAINSELKTLRGNKEDE